MTICAFIGPSLPSAEAEKILNAVYLPPARRGDIRRAVSDHKADTIALIDGYFENVPSVWHKEILWAIDLGVAVWGASSMGALRAAELAQFGMQGHGRIFEAYRTGRFDPFDDPFEDDDEVAVVHGPDDLSHLATDAMVDIRATLAAAEIQGVIETSTRDRLAKTAKSLFYKQRTWRAILCGTDLPPDVTSRLTEWLATGRISQKRLDAQQLLQHLASGARPAEPPPFTFERTLLWEIAEADRDA